MVAIGNFNIDTSGWLGTVYNVGIFGVGTLIAMGIIGWIIYAWYKKVTFRYPVTLTNIRQNHTTKEQSNLKGGIVKGKGGIADFKIIIPRKWRKKKLGYVPDFSLCDADNRLHFIQVGDGTIWQQVNKKIQYEKELPVPMTEHEIKTASDSIVREIEVYYKDQPQDMKSQIYEKSMDHWIQQRNLQTKKQTILLEPVPTDVKTVTINAIHDVQALTEKNKMTAMMVGIGAFVIMAIVQIVFLYLTRKR